MSFLGSKTNTKSILLVATNEERVVGWCSVSPVSDRWAYRVTGVISTYVDRDYQGVGIGSALKHAMFERCEKAGYHSIIGEVLSTNPKSILNNMKLGFHIIGEIREAGFRGTNWIDLIIMQKIMNETTILERQLRFSVTTTDIEKTASLYQNVLGLQMRPLSNAIAMFPLGYAELEVCHNEATQELLGVEIGDESRGVLITILRTNEDIEKIRQASLEFAVTELPTDIEGAWSFTDFNGISWLIEKEPEIHQY